MMKSMQKEIDKRFMKAYLPLLVGMGMTDQSMNPLLFWGKEGHPGHGVRELAVSSQNGM
jgi:hypothetical protein